MTVKVDPSELYKLSQLLMRNCDYFHEPLRGYLDKYLNKTDGLTGVLWPAQWAVHKAHDISVELMDSGKTELNSLGMQVLHASNAYQESDQKAAEKLLLTYGKAAPKDWRERDDGGHRGDYRDVFVPRPAPPDKSGDMKYLVKKIKKDLHHIDSLLSKVGLPRLSDKVLPKISGDWDVLREIASGYGKLAARDGIQPIADNIVHGTDSVSSTWNGPAARQYDWIIRGRWVPAIDYIQHFFEFNKEYLELLAQIARDVFVTLGYFIDEVIKWLIKKILHIAKAILKPDKAIHELMEAMVEIWYTIKTLLHVVEETIRTVGEAMGALGAEAKIINDMMRGKRGVLTE